MRGASMRHSQQLAAAFVAGGLLTYLCVCIMARMGARLGFLGPGLTAHAQLATPVLLERCSGGLPPTWGLSPLALGNQTGDVHATPDRLIVAVHHTEVIFWPLCFYTERLRSADPCKFFQCEPGNEVSIQCRGFACWLLPWMRLLPCVLI